MYRPAGGRATPIRPAAVCAGWARRRPRI